MAPNEVAIYVEKQIKRLVMEIFDFLKWWFLDKILNAKEGGGGNIFWHGFNGERMILFFEKILKKLRLHTMGKTTFFWELDFPWGGRIFFCNFFWKSWQYVLWGKWLFSIIWIDHGVVIFLIYWKRFQLIPWGNYIFSNMVFRRHKNTQILGFSNMVFRRP